MEFIEPDSTFRPDIKVIGVGGAGGNAVNHLLTLGLQGVDLLVANTDRQHLAASPVRNKIPLGESPARRQGAGGNPEAGKAAAEESRSRLREALRGANLVFITAGLGKGTGTGAAPLAAGIARELGAITVAVVTTPFTYEGNRLRLAQAGLARLRAEADCLIVLSNARLEHNTHTPFAELLQRADAVLAETVSNIASLVNNPGFMNLDFADLKSVIAHSGLAFTGSGSARGEGRGLAAAKAALNAPMLDYASALKSARHLLYSISFSANTPYEDIQEAAQTITSAVHPEAEIFFGTVFKDADDDELGISLIATGLEATDEAKTPEAPRLDFSYGAERHPQASTNVATGVATGATGVATKHSKWHRSYPPLQRAIRPYHAEKNDFHPAHRALIATRQSALKI